MSDVTVSYKGGTIKSFGLNQTETLATEAQWMEDDVTINALWNWLGANAELVSSFADFEVALKDTAFNTWTPSETATQILATATFGTISANVKDYDYVVKWTFDTDLKYLAGATMKSMPIYQKAICFAQTFRRPRYYADLTARNYNYNQLSGNTTYAPFFLYYNASGTKTIGLTQTYGFYMTPQTITLSSNTADTVTLTLPRPALYARCQSSYMPTARAAEIDKNNSKLRLKCEVYRVRKTYTAQSIIKEIVEGYSE